MATDKLNFSGINFGSENFVTPLGSLSDRLMKYGASLNEQENAKEKLRLLEEDKAYQRERDSIQDARQDKKDKRLDLETAAQDLYKNELFKGQQTKGGSYGDALAADSNKYDLTQIEQTNVQKYFANGMYDTNAMRKSGDNVLADKIDWQTKVSNGVESFIESGVGKESRPEMYDRVGSIIASKGLPVPESLVASADQARLSEAKTLEDKLKDIETQRSDILKKNREDNWKLVNAKTNSGGETVYDADGNELQVGRRTANSLKKEYDSGVNDAGDSIKIIQESINKLDKIEPEKKAAAISQVNSVINAVAARGVPIDEAARMVSGELTQKGDGSWFFEEFNPEINKKAVDAYADQMVKNMPKKQNVTYSSNNDGASKFDLASELVAQNRAADAETLAKLNSEKAKLLIGEEARRANRIDEWLKSQGLKSSEPVKSNNIDSVQTKTPGSESSYANEVRKSEGKYDSVNTKSGALGAYQFLPSTLEGLKKQTGEKFSNEEFLANKQLQDKYFNLLTKNNAGRLEALGLAPTSMNLYIAHNLGPGYVKEMQELDRNPSAGLQKALEANGLDSKEEWYKRNKKYAGIDSNIKNSNIKIEDWNAAQNYYANNGGILDRNKNIHDIMVDKKIGRQSAEKYYDETIKPEVDALKKSLNPVLNYKGEGAYSDSDEYKQLNGYKGLSLKEQMEKNKQNRINSQENANLLRRIKELNIDASQEEQGLEHSNLDVFPVLGGKVADTVSKFIPKSEATGFTINKIDEVLGASDNAAKQSTNLKKLEDAYQEAKREYELFNGDRRTVAFKELSRRRNEALKKRDAEILIESLRY